MFKEYLVNPKGYWNVLPNICCNLTQKIPLYLHIVGASIITIFGPVQLLNVLVDRNDVFLNFGHTCLDTFFCRMNIVLLKIKSIHSYTGIIYANGFLLAASGGLMFIYYNGTVGGLWMTVPFTIYGVLMLIYPTVTVVYIILGRKRSHYYWALRTFSLGASSIFYRTLYQITCYILVECGDITFNDPMDRAFNWLFFLIPLILTELYIRLCRSKII